MSDNLYSIKEIADMIGVSKQAIHKKIKQEPLSTSLRQLMTTVDGAVYVAVDGLTLIKQAFNKDSPSTVDDNLTTTADKKVDDPTTKTPHLETLLIDSLQSQITFLIDQIENKDESLKNKDEKINELTNKITDLTERLATLFENSQQLQQNQQLLEAKTIKAEENNPEEDNKKGFFKKIKQFFFVL